MLEMHQIKEYGLQAETQAERVTACAWDQKRERKEVVC